MRACVFLYLSRLLGSMKAVIHVIVMFRTSSLCAENFIVNIISYFQVKQGDESHELFFLIHGSLVAEQGGRPVADLDEGAFFGEIALILEHTRRTVTIRAKTDVNMLMLTRESMNAALDRFALVHVLAFSQCNSFPEEKEKLIGLAHKTMVAQEAQEIMRESSNAEEEKMEAVLKRALGEKNREVSATLLVCY